MKAINESSFEDIISNGKKQLEGNTEALKKNGGLCLCCGKNEADINSEINTFHCEECNKETEETIGELNKYSGFVGFKLPKMVKIK